MSDKPEGVECWISEEGVWHSHYGDPLAKKGLAFTLPELAARDAAVRKEALEEAADFILNREGYSTSRFITAIFFADLIRALAKEVE